MAHHGVDHFQYIQPPPCNVNDFVVVASISIRCPGDDPEFGISRVVISLPLTLKLSSADKGRLHWMKQCVNQALDRPAKYRYQNREHEGSISIKQKRWLSQHAYSIVPYM